MAAELLTGLPPSLVVLGALPVQQQHPSSINPNEHLLLPLPPNIDSIAAAAAVPEPIGNGTLLAQVLAKSAPRRPRGEKKPIPEDKKDGRYFERRKRNNLAAKKSRDQRKVREDTVTVRAETLEKENAALRVQVSTLREEMGSLQTLLLRKRLNQQQRRKELEQLVIRGKLGALLKHLGTKVLEEQKQQQQIIS